MLTGRFQGLQIPRSGRVLQFHTSSVLLDANSDLKGSEWKAQRRAPEVPFREVRDYYR